MLSKRLLTTAVLVPSIFALAFFAPAVIIVFVLIVLGSLSLLEFYAIMEKANVPIFKVVPGCKEPLSLL